MMALLLSLAGVYFLGSVSPSYLLGKSVRGIDLREHGSGNVGTTNAFRVLGRGPGILTLLFDVGKGFFAIKPFGAFVASRFSVPVDPLLFQILLGLGVIAGHNWSVFLRFRGGKGVATTFGVFLAIAPLSVSAGALVWLLVVLLRRNIGLGSLVGAFFTPIAMMVLREPLPVLLFGIAMVAAIVYTHRSNIRKILSGTKSE